LDRRKGFDKCLQIVNGLKKKNLAVNLQVGGIFTDENYRKECESYIQQYGLESNIKFNGYIEHEHKIKLINSCGVFLLLSQGEGVSMSLLETMKAGLAPIASDIDTNRELFVDSGLDLFSLEDVDQMIEKIRLYHKSPEVLKKDQNKARQIVKPFTIENHIDGCVRAIEQTLCLN
ncbi:MAG: glycosyltransferase, partial [Bacteroidia bacterium]